jgi:hypothetical protein
MRTAKVSYLATKWPRSSTPRRRCLTSPSGDQRAARGLSLRAGRPPPTCRTIGTQLVSLATPMKFCQPQSVSGATLGLNGETDERQHNFARALQRGSNS